MLSVIVPVYNEEQNIIQNIRNLQKALASFPNYEIIIVDDGSTDGSAQRIQELKGERDIVVVTHPENIGYGKSLLDGALAARHDCLAIIDADGSYDPSDIALLYQKYPMYDMVVGSREGEEYRRGLFKRPARLLFNRLAEYATGRRIPDINSGLRVFRKDVVIKFREDLCTGFSFTTTITLIFMLNHYYVKYLPIRYQKRVGKSKVNHFNDTLRAGQIIVQAFLYYNPVKLFLLLAVLNLLAGFLLWGINLLFFHSEFLALAAVIAITSFVPVFGMGLIADQIRRARRANS